MPHLLSYQLTSNTFVQSHKTMVSTVISLCKQYYLFFYIHIAIKYILSLPITSIATYTTHCHSIHCSYSLSYQSPLSIYCLMYHFHFRQYIFSMLFTLHSSQFITHLYYYTIYLYVIHNFFLHPPHIITFFSYHIYS